MKKLLLIITVFAACNLTAQTNYEIIWDFGSNPGNADAARNGDRTVELGDTVTWVFAGGSTHTVDSYDAGDESASGYPGFNAAQAFTSGPTRLGPGTMFPVTFNTLGVNPYRCVPHPGSMNGTITVVEVLSTQEKFRLNLKSYPNPVQEELNITSLIRISSVEVFSILGKRVLASSVDNLTNTSVNMNGLQTGVYFVNVIAENGEKSTLRVIKK